MGQKYWHSSKHLDLTCSPREGTPAASSLTKKCKATLWYLYIGGEMVTMRKKGAHTEPLFKRLSEIRQTGSPEHKVPGHTSLRLFNSFSKSSKRLLQLFLQPCRDTIYKGPSYNLTNSQPPDWVRWLPLYDVAGRETDSEFAWPAYGDSGQVVPSLSCSYASSFKTVEKISFTVTLKYPSGHVSSPVLVLWF